MPAPLVLFLIGALAAAVTQPSSQVPNQSPLVSSTAADKSQVQLYPTPSDDSVRQKLPVNLARGYLGASITAKPDSKKVTTNSVNVDSQIDGLIRDDDSFRYEMPVGTTAFMLSMPQSVNTNRAVIISENLSGTVQIFASNVLLDPDGKWWQPLSTPTDITSGKPLQITWAWASVRYVKVVFNLKQAGRLGPLELFGAPTLKDVKTVQLPAKETDVPTTDSFSGLSDPSLVTPITRQINVGSMMSRARVTHVSSGLDRPQQAVSMIDEDGTTYYAFDPNDPNPSLLLQLDQHHEVCRISTYYDAGPGSWEIYPLDEWPQDSDPSAPGAKPSHVTDMHRATPYLGASHLASFPAALTSILLAETAQTADAPKILHLPANFYQNHKPAEVIPNQPGGAYGEVTFSPQEYTLILMRWVPDAAKPPTPRGMIVYQISVYADPHHERWDALPANDFATLGEPDLGGAHGLDTGKPPTLPPVTPDPPRIIPQPPVVSP